MLGRMSRMNKPEHAGADDRPLILHGRLLIDPHEPLQPGWMRIERGRIVQMEEGSPRAMPDAGDEHSIICPAFVDAHLHLPQFGCTGCDGMELLAWLDEVIFPAEMRWADCEIAAASAMQAVRDLYEAGTFTFAGYLTAHEQSWDAMMQGTASLPLRGAVGQVLMDRHAPAALIGNPQRWPDSLPARLEASINPRFAVSCSDELLACAGRLAAQHAQALIQTHLAESRAECELVASLFPNDAHYTAVYDRHGLLTDRTLLAHALHLSDDEWRLIASRGCVVVHCPTANAFLRAGVFNLDKAREHCVRLALGSDIAAGPDLAMPRIARAMIETAKLRSMMGPRGVHVPTPAEAWHCITAGNADALSMPDAGRLAIGAAADLLVLRPDVTFDRHVIGRLIYGWEQRWITHRVLNGRLFC